MTIQRQDLSDTVSLLYDLGTAHGRFVYGSIENFANDILKIAGDNDLLTFTNSQQTKERAFLKEIGFSCDNIQIHTGNSSDRMMGHFITNDDLKKNTKEIAELLEKRQKVEAAAQEFFRAKINDNEKFKVGDCILYNEKIPDFRTRVITSTIYLYRIIEVLPSGRVLFARDGETHVYRNYEYGDGGYPSTRLFRPYCTSEEYEEKVKELMNASS